MLRTLTDNGCGFKQRLKRRRSRHVERFQHTSRIELKAMISFLNMVQSVSLHGSPQLTCIGDQRFQCPYPPDASTAPATSTSSPFASSNVSLCIGHPRFANPRCLPPYRADDPIMGFNDGICNRCCPLHGANCQDSKAAGACDVPEPIHCPAGYVYMHERG